MNLIEGVLQEMNRVRELLPLYKSLPDGVGMFGASVIENNIKRAEHVIASGDVVEMLQVYHDLKECE